MNVALPRPGDGTLAVDDQPAVFSANLAYRYVLRRIVGMGVNGRLLVVLLNPSTADDYHNDPTVRRCIRFARDWGYSQLSVCNLFAYRATDPHEMKRAADPVGPENDQWIAHEASRSDFLVAGWGVHGGWKGRQEQALAILRRFGPVHCWGMTRSGQPRHPLFVPLNYAPRRLLDGIMVDGHLEPYPE